MPRRLQVVLSEKSWECIDEALASANAGFDEGQVYAADVIEFAIQSVKIDVNELRSRKRDVRKKLRKTLASTDPIDLNVLIEELKAIKAAGENSMPPRRSKSSVTQVKQNG